MTRASASPDDGIEPCPYCGAGEWAMCRLADDETCPMFDACEVAN